MSSTGQTSEGAAYHEVASLLSSKIREVRKAKGLTIEQLAHQVGMGAGLLSLYENGRMGRSIDRQIQILLALGLSRNDIASVIAVSGD